MYTHTHTHTSKVIHVVENSNSTEVIKIGSKIPPFPKDDDHFQSGVRPRRPFPRLCSLPEKHTQLPWAHCVAVPTLLNNTAVALLCTVTTEMPRSF